MHQRRPCGVMRAVGDVVGSQQLRHRADRARRTQRLLPALRREGLQRLFELGAGGDLRGAEGGSR